MPPPSAVGSAAEVDERAAERAALLQFKSSVRSDPAGLLALWTDSRGSDACSWPGVSCDARSRVVELSVSGRCGTGAFMWSWPFWRVCSGKSEGLEGVISPAIGQLSELRVLRLPFHGFVGEIPGEIWGLRNLEVLDLEGSSVSGALPSRFPQGLRVLSLGANQISGKIPASLSDCLNLEILDLSRNQINGTVPAFLGGLPKLSELHLSFNRLVGSIPSELGDGCGNLKHLDLSGNLLVRGIPGNLGNCSELRSLLLFSNMLEDILPAEIGRLTNLRVLDVSRNSLSSFVPVEIGNCKELSVLVLSNPYHLVTFRESLDDGGGDFNYFQGGIPESITSLPKLRVLWAPRSSLEGPIPTNWGACEGLEVVNLAQNLFTGEVPVVFEQCRNLRYLNISYNKLTGWLKEQLPVPCMDVFDVSENLLSGSIPRFSCNATRSIKFLPYDLPSAYSRFLAYQPVSGSLQSLVGSNGPTVFHSFGGNNFTGPLPALPIIPGRFGKQTSYAFLADSNSLAGSFPGTLFDQCKALDGLFINIKSHHRRSSQDFGSLHSLLGLDLSRNSLQGQIPVHFSQLKELEYLLLAGNNLTGEIPFGISQMHSLRVLDLSSNALSGEIPDDLVSLRNLSVLLLNNNKLSGKLPSAVANVSSLSIFNPCHLPSLSIPPPELEGQSGRSLSYGTSPPESPITKDSHGFSPIEIASITSAAAIVSILLALIVLYIYTRRCTPRSAVRSSGRREVTVFTDIGVPLTYENVVRATGNFNASNCIGSGGFGATYKAEISPGVLVAIKRLSVGRFQGVQQFHAEIKTLGRWRHPNLVTLIGYHVSESEMFLIYNYLPGGNLEKFIRDRSKRAVDWRMLHKIALDVARALAYLHDHCVPRILHRDVKPSNILLDNELNAYLSDFGLARLLGNSETHATTGVAGTFGYVAPEYAMTCRVSDKADVYSYGVVLLELLSDKKALDPSFSPYGNGFNIVAWAAMLHQQGRHQEFFTEGLWDASPHEDLVEALHLAVMCTVDSLSIRPTMKQVVQRLKQLQPPNS
ncbi:unnamed protein product [Spirodela intermedia]|uniref:non-specific serine/threonine protein kinase n=1 Tax=Spirodela intermedia TaxID=51605 RepID=A0A7I8IYZ8_SPIIN|nr:unnamed protein product [Spirodela intermedia]CAA6662942.1 unnamed protein product [Spirodela intermedia]